MENLEPEPSACLDSKESQPPPPDESLQSQPELHQRSHDHATETNTPIRSPPTGDFAQSASPASPVDELDRSTNICDSGIGGCSTASLKSIDSLPRRVSPFEQAFASTDLFTSPFATRKTGSLRSKAERSPEGLRETFEEQPVVPPVQNIQPSEPVNDNLPQRLGGGESTDQESGKEGKEESSHEQMIEGETEVRGSETSKITENVSNLGIDALQESKTSESLLGALEKAIDDQLITQHSAWLHQHDDDNKHAIESPSSIRTLPHLVNESTQSQELEHCDSYQSLEVSSRRSSTTKVEFPRSLSGSPAQVLSDEPGWNQQEEHWALQDSLAVVRKDTMIVVVDVNDDDGETTIISLADTQSLHETTAPLEQDSLKSSDSRTSTSSTTTSETSSIALSSVVFPDGPKQPVFHLVSAGCGVRLTSPVSLIVVPTVKHARRNTYPSCQHLPARGLTIDKMAEGPPSIDQEQDGTSESTVSPTSTSKIDEIRNETATEIISTSEDIPANVTVSETQLTQIQSTVSQALEDFKVDMMQKFETIISDATRLLIPARNSVTAMLLSRPSVHDALTQSESAVKTTIVNLRDEMLNKLDHNKTEAIGHNMRMAKILKKEVASLVDPLKVDVANMAESLEICIVNPKDAVKKVRVVHKGQPLKVYRRPKATLMGDFLRSTTQDEAQSTDHLVVSSNLEPSAQSDHASDLMEEMKSLTATNTKEILQMLEQCIAKNTTHQHQDMFQDSKSATPISQSSSCSNASEVANILRQVLIQSSLQNHSINNLTDTQSSLLDSVRNMSHNAALIDAKLAQNATTSATSIETTRTLDDTATRLCEVISDVKAEFKSVAVKTVDSILHGFDRSRTANTDDIQTSQMEALQDQMTRLEARLEHLTTTLTRDYSIEAQSNDYFPASARPASTDPATLRSRSAPTSTQPRAGSQDTQPNPTTITVDATFEMRNGDRLSLDHPIILPISQLTTIPLLISKIRTLLTKDLAKQGITRASFELIAVWVPVTHSVHRRMVDNDLAYDGWYRTLRDGSDAEMVTLIQLEFVDCPADDEEGSVGRKDKKRKLDVMTRGSGGGVRFRLDVWGNMRQRRFEVSK